MASKKNKYRDCSEERRVELLKKYYEFDEATKTFDIVLHFEKASEIFDERFDLLKKRVMKAEVIEKAAELIMDVPRGYKAELSLVIDDYEGIPYREILEAFHSVLNIRVARFKRARRRKYHKVGTLILIGMFLIALMILGEVLQWWGGERIEGRLVSYAIDTAGCVLIWEGLYSALLERSEDAALGYAISSRLSAIGLYRNDGSEDALLTEHSLDTVMIEKDSLGKKAGSACLYLSGFLLVGSGLISIILRWPALVEILMASPVLAVVLAIIEIILSLFVIGLGFLAIMMFNEDYRLYILTAVMSVVILGMAVLAFLSLFSGGASTTNIITSITHLVSLSLFVIGFGLATYHNRRDIARTLGRKK